MTTREPAPRRRSRRGAAAVLVVAAGFSVAGCGERFGPGSAGPGDPSTAQAAEAPPLPPPTTPAPSTTPAASTPTTPRSVDQLGEDENIGGVIWQPRAIYEGPVQISVRDGYLAAVVSKPGATAGELRVSPDGAEPVAAEGAGPVPTWARPHVGTDVSGRVVVTYPRCQDNEAVGTCDIYQWTAETGREIVLRGVSGGELAETEAVMDFGAVLVVREKRPVLSADDLQFDTPSLTTLLIKPRGRPIRVVTRHGGRQIDLRGSRVADVFTLPESSSEICPDQAARALNIEGLTVASRVVKCNTPDGFAYPSGPSVADNHLRFAVTVLGQPGTALDHDLATGRTRTAKLTLPVEWWTADGDRSGFATDTVGGSGMCSPVKREDYPSDSACRILRSAKLVWKPVQEDWKVRAGDTPVQD